MTLTREMMADLARPFPPEAVNWKPQATTPDKKRAMAVPYVDMRHYIERLNQVIGPDWSDEYVLQDGGKVVVCLLTIAGVTRSDVGEAEAGDQNTVTTALAQAFKRTCVKFGLGAYLYRLPKPWADYDAQKRGFTEQAMARLHKLLQTGKDAGLLARAVPAGEHAGKTLGWLLENDRAYLERVAKEASDPSLREAARQALAA